MAQTEIASLETIAESCRREVISRLLSDIRPKENHVLTNFKSQGQAPNNREDEEHCKEFRPTDQAISISSPYYEVTKLSVMTQTVIETGDSSFQFSSRQQLEEKLALLQRRHEEQLRNIERVNIQQSQGGIQSDIIAFEKELQKQMQRGFMEAVDATRMEEARNHKKEIELLRLNLEDQYNDKIQRSISAEREIFQRQLELLQKNESTRLQEQGSFLREMEQQRNKIDFERMQLEAKKTILYREEEACKKRMSEFETRMKGFEKNEADTKHKIELECSRGLYESKRTYEAAMEAVASQKKNYSKEILSIQKERKLLSLARSNFEEKTLEIARLEQMASFLQKEKHSLQERLQAAETQLREIGILLGAKTEIIGTCRELVKRAMRFRDVKNKLRQSHLEIQSCQKMAKEENDQLIQKVISAENCASKTRKECSKLLAEVEMLKHELKLSRTECAELSSLLRECQMILENLGSVQRPDEIYITGWGSKHLNARRAIELNASSSDETTSLLLQRLSSFRKSSAETQLGHPLGTRFATKCQHYVHSSNSRAFNENRSDQVQKNMLFSEVQPSNNSLDHTSAASVVFSTGDNRPKVNISLPTTPSTNRNQRASGSSEGTKGNVASQFFDMMHHQTSMTSKSFATSSGEGMPLTSGSHTPNKCSVSNEVVQEASILSDGTAIEVKKEKSPKVALDPNCGSAVSGMMDRLHSSCIDYTPMPAEEAAAMSFDGTNKEVQSDIITNVATEPNCNAAVEGSEHILKESRDHACLTSVAAGVSITSKQIDDSIVNSQSYNVASSSSDTKNRSLDKLDETIPLEQNNYSAPRELVSDCRQSAAPLHPTETLDIYSVEYSMNGFDEETKFEVTEKTEQTDVESVMYSMNWSKAELDDSTGISTQVEKSQGDTTFSIEVISAQYESGVEYNDDNW